MNIDKFIVKKKIDKENELYIFTCPNCKEFSTSSLSFNQIRNSALYHMESKDCIWNGEKKKHYSGNDKFKSG